MKVFLTGGSGFLGKEIIKRLVKDRHEVSALARSDASTKALHGLGVERVVSGSLADIALWEKALVGCDVVVHCAAPVELWGPWKKFEQEIVASTSELLLAADRTGVKRFIYVSSESVLQDTLPLVDIDESFPYPKEPNSYYGKSKKLAELAILKAPVSIERIILRPTFIWGTQSQALENIATTARKGGFMWLNQGQSAFEAVHVENVVESVRLALTRGRDGGIYFVTDGEKATVREFFTSYFEAVGVKVPEKNISANLVRGAAKLMENLWPRTRKPPVTTFEVAFLAMPRRYNIGKITNELGYRPVISRADGFRECVLNRRKDG